jgi:hypothetical protein
VYLYKSDLNTLGFFGAPQNSKGFRSVEHEVVPWKMGDRGNTLIRTLFFPFIVGNKLLTFVEAF